jgi:hypothetical protein
MPESSTEETNPMDTVAKKNAEIVEGLRAHLVALLPQLTPEVESALFYFPAATGSESAQGV